jgi:hypothetical protein
VGAPGAARRVVWLLCVTGKRRPQSAGRSPPGRGEIHTMGFNKRKMKAQRAAAAEKQASAKRATEAQEL